MTQSTAIRSSTAIEKTFNGPFIRQQLYALPQYAASSEFNTLVSWRNSHPDILAVTAPAGSNIVPVRVVIVGKVSADKAYLLPNGTFSPAFGDSAKKISGAKLAFSLERPDDDPDFSADWDIAYAALEAIQAQIAVTTKRNFFLLGDSKTIRLNFPLAEPKSARNTTAKRNAYTKSYNVNAECSPFFETLKMTHQMCRMPVFDLNENVDMDPSGWEDKLVGALVEVAFTLIHYYITPTPARPASDTFTAKVVAVTVLVEPAPIDDDNEYMDSPRKPKRVPQTPSRSEQINAARAFVPFPAGIPQPNFGGAGGSSSGAGSNVAQAAAGLGQSGVTDTSTQATGKGKHRQYDTEDDDDDIEDDTADTGSPSKKSKLL